MTPQRFKKLQTILQRRQLDLTVLMDNVHKPHNLSAIVRSCDAVGVHHLHAVTRFDRLKIAKDITSGSGKWVNLHMHASLDDAVTALRGQNMQILAAHLSEQTVDFRTIDYTRPTAIMFGTELYGVSQQGLDLADQHIIIPMLGMIDSLNVSVAAALVLFEAQRQRQVQGFYERQQLDVDTYNKTLFEWAHPKLAAFYQRKGLAYPALDEQGDILEQETHIRARLTGKV